MKIDWKHLATTKGYKSLKKTYIEAVQEAGRRKFPMRDKAEYLRQFKWIISRAKHYAYKTGIPIDVVLNGWENKRTYCWLNYYQDCSQPRFHSKAKKLLGIKGIRKYYKTSSFGSKYVNGSVCKFIQKEHKKNSMKKKKRWDMDYKRGIRR